MDGEKESEKARKREGEKDSDLTDGHKVMCQNLTQ